MSNVRKKNSPVQSDQGYAIPSQKMITLVYQFPANLLGISKCGNYFQLPFSMQGEMVDGSDITPAFFKKGRPIIPTKKGKKSFAKDSKGLTKVQINMKDYI